MSTLTGRIDSAYRLNASANGNPRWGVVVEIENTNSRITLQTQTDSSAGYDIENLLGTGRISEFNLSRAGRIVTVTPVPEVSEPDDPEVDADTLSDWQYEVANGDTVLGLADWVAHRNEVSE